MDDKIALAELKDIEIFEAGTYRGREYTDADLDTMVANFAALKDEIKPVAVIGHDEDQELLKRSGIPAAGWMESVKRVGRKLVASFKDVPQILAEIISKGGFKRISSEIYNNYNGRGLALRRVAILGGDIPEVKTLADIAALYSDSPEGKTTWVTLSEAAPRAKEEHMDDLKKLQEELDKLSGQVTALAEENKTLKARLEVPPPKEILSMDTMELAEQVTILQESVNDLKQSSTDKDARIADLESRNKDTVQKLSEAEQQRKKDDIKRFCQDRIREGRLSPALYHLGLESFMSSLDDSEVTRFGEGKKTFDLTPLGFMKNFFMAIPRNTLVRFGEVAKTGGEPNPEDLGKTAADRLTEATQKLMAANSSLKFAEAFIEAQKQNPDLAMEYASEIVGH